MDNFHKLNFTIFLILFFVSGLALADTYKMNPTFSVRSFINSSSLTAGSGPGACSSALTELQASSPSFASYTVEYKDSDTSCTLHNANGGDSGVRYVDSFPSCLHGGVVSGEECINAPACPLGKSRKYSTGECYISPICTPPEVDIDGKCGVNECTGGKVLNGTTGQCQTKPNCAAAETYVNATNSCRLLPLGCPWHSHPSSANDRCLPDPPLTCQTGMHDDGTYKCIADDAILCKSNEVKGYIFGIPQCIKKSNVHEASKIADDAAAAQTAAESVAAAAQTAADNAAAAAAAEPDNVTLQQAADDAVSNNTSRQKQLANSKKEADEAHKAQDSEALKSISESAKELADSNREDHDAGFGDAPSAEVIDSTSFNVSGLPSGSSTGTCPPPYQIHTSHGTILMSYAPECEFAQKISPLILTFAYLSAGLIVLGPIRD